MRIKVMNKDGNLSIVAIKRMTIRIDDNVLKMIFSTFGEIDSYITVLRRYKTAETLAEARREANGVLTKLSLDGYANLVQNEPTSDISENWNIC